MFKNEARKNQALHRKFFWSNVIIESVIKVTIKKNIFSECVCVFLCVCCSDLFILSFIKNWVNGVNTQKIVAINNFQLLFLYNSEQKQIKCETFPLLHTNSIHIMIVAFSPAYSLNQSIVQQI